MDSLNLTYPPFVVCCFGKCNFRDGSTGKPIALVRGKEPPSKNLGLCTLDTTAEIKYLMKDKKANLVDVQTKGGLGLGQKF